MTSPSATPRGQRRIAIVLHEDSFYIRSVLRGVASFARPARPWLLDRVPPEGLGRRSAGLRQCEGIITHIHHPSILDALAGLACPVVCVSNLIPEDPFPSVTTDDAAIGGTAFEHLASHGHRSFAFVGLGRLMFSQQRRDGFVHTASRAGVTVDCREIPAGWLKRSPRADAPTMRRFAGWLRGLPRPTGLFACNDAVAWLVSEVCRRSWIEVPLEIAVLGVDNDDLLCRLAYPPLSSVIVPSERVGYLAAQQLDDAMTTGRPIVSTRLPPTGVATRQSSAFYAVDDADVAAALAHIRDHATQGLTVGELLREVPIGRRSLERRFRALLGRTPLDEIQRVRVDAARQMLVQTTLPIEEVAVRCGFGRANYMSRLLVRFTGQTPRAIRMGRGSAS